MSGAVSERNYQMLSAKYQEEQERLAARCEAIHADAAEDAHKHENAEKWVELIRQMGTPTELTAPLLNAVIDKIVIHEAVEDEAGIKDQEIEIFYRFIGKVE